MTIKELKKWIDDYIAGMGGDITEDTEVAIEAGGMVGNATRVSYLQRDENNEIVLTIVVD